ncbi:hypothetical protein B0H14DRAFT_3130248 [Mycena olivaceomarginata]|nr:hypothetical protein B0H14DRAFT_3130248 [Mycena olivaceomarginata]
MLGVLREKIVGDPDLVRTVRVEAVELSAKLSETFEKRDSVDYDQSLSTRWLRSLGEDIFCRGEQLVTIAHLGAHNKQKHWVAIEVDGAKLQFRYGDSLGKAIPRNMQMVYEWWASKHVPGQLEFSSLPISSQTDGHSCGMLAVNAIEHPFIQQADVVLGRLAVFDQLVSRILDRIADEQEEEEDKMPASDLVAAITIQSPPRSFAKIARSATFTFKLGEPANPSTFNFSEQDDSTTLKRPKDHPDAPTPNASPEKKRVREVERDRTPPPPFNLLPEPGPLPPLAEGSSTETTPGGSDVFGTKVLPQKSSAPKGTIQSFFSVATKEEKAMERAREAERRNEKREEREARDVRQKFLAKTKVTEDTNKRKRKQRAKERAVKVAAGWVPGNRGRKRKIIELETADHTSFKSSKVAEDSRPRRQFQEDMKKNNKPCGA